MAAVVWALLLVLGCEAKDDFLSHLTRETCMDELGCFSAGSPFFDILERPLSLLPDDRAKINTRFQLYTPRNPRAPRTFSNLDRSVDALGRSAFDFSGNTSVLIPGYIGRTAPGWKHPLIEAILAATSNNVFLVDWSDGDGPLYEQAVANTRVVGAEIALLIQKIQNASIGQASGGVKPESFHLIGHSLGAHIAGYAGKRIQNLGRITAMDPAGPYFTNVDPVVRLDRRDALFVDAIHTNAAPSRFLGFGLAESIAHIDFYPNGGHLQPGCKDMGQAIWSFLKNPSFDAEGLADIQCNHKRAILLFISSIHSQCQLTGTLCGGWDDFVAARCGQCRGEAATPGCAPMGWHADTFPRANISDDKSINFYLNTTDMDPYCVL